MFLIKHRSITPPLYVGEGTLVDTVEKAVEFPTRDEGEQFLKALGAMGPLYLVVPKLEILR